MVYKKAITVSVASLAVIVGIMWHGAYQSLPETMKGFRAKAIPIIRKFVYYLYAANMFTLGRRIKLIRTVLDFFTIVELDDYRLGKWKQAVDVEDLEIAGIPVTIFLPNTEITSLPGLIHFHGGGFILGSRKHKAHMILCLMLGKATKSIVISDDYRQTPENVFPAQFNDAFAVVSAEEPSKFGIDGSKIALIAGAAEDR